MKRIFVLFWVTIFILSAPANLRSETYTFAVAANSIDTVVSEVILKKAYEMMGHSINIIRLPPKRALIDANAGLYDGDVQRIFSVAENYPNLIRVEPTINYIQGTGFILNNAKIAVSTWKDLAPYKVGIILGIRFAERNVPKNQALVFYNYKELTRALNNGTISIGIYPHSNGIYQSILSGEKDIVPLESPLAEFELFHYVHKKNTYLIAGLQKIFKQFKIKGTLKKVRQRVLEISFDRARNGLEPCFENYACYESVWDDYKF